MSSGIVWNMCTTMARLIIRIRPEDEPPGKTTGLDDADEFCCSRSERKLQNKWVAEPAALSWVSLVPSIGHLGREALLVKSC